MSMDHDYACVKLQALMHDLPAYTGRDCSPPHTKEAWGGA